MKRRSLAVRILVMLSLLALTAACGGGGGGGGSSAPAKGNFVKAAEPAAAATYFSGMFATTPASRYMLLLTAADIKGSGYIRSLRFNAYTAGVASSVTCTNVTIKMGATTVATLSTTFGDNVEQGAGSFTTVLDASAITIPVTAAGDYYNIDLTTPFYYNGKDNLIIEVTRDAACSAMAPVAANAAAYTGVVYIGGSSTATTGSAGTYSIHTELVFAGGDDAVEYGGAGSAPTPFASLWRTQVLYLASEITGTGPITGIGLQANATTVTGSYTYTLKLGHTTVSALTATFANNFNAGTPSTIVSSGSFTIPAGVPAGDYIWIPFPGTFTYNGKDNLIVDIDVSAGTASNSVRYAAVGSDTRLIYDTTGSTVATSGNTAALHTKFRFNGGKIMVLPNVGAGGSGQVLGVGAAGQIQSVYNNTMLGTSGTINNVYVRLRSTATPTSATLTNYKLYMGHTTKSALSLADTYASNMDGMATVFNGTLTVPAGVKAGDWVKIPLSQAFSYDSSKNLSILFATDAGPSGNTVSTHFDVTLFPSNTVGRNDNSVAPSGLPAWDYDGIVDLAVDISK